MIQTMTDLMGFIQAKHMVPTKLTKNTITVISLPFSIIDFDCFLGPDKKQVLFFNIIFIIVFNKKKYITRKYRLNFPYYNIWQIRLVLHLLRP